jgi:acetyl-CoA acetyltransferase
LVSNDSLNAFIHGCMLVASGRLENVVISAYAKPSNIQNYGEVVLNMLDPHTVRPLLPHYHVLAALDAHAYLINTTPTAHSSPRSQSKTWRTL